MLSNLGSGFGKHVMIPAFPVAHLTFRVGLCNVIALHNLGHKLLASTVDFIQMLVGQPCPVLLDRTFEMFPVSFNKFPVHDILPICELIQLQPTSTSLLVTPRY